MPAWALEGYPGGPSPRRALLEPRPVLVELRGTLFAVSRPPADGVLDEDVLWTDDGLPLPAPGEWTDDERRAVEDAVFGGECGCEYCRNVLPFALRPAWRAGRPGDAVAAWSALAALPTEVAAARASLAAFDDGSDQGTPELAALGAALAVRGLEPPRAFLARMLVRSS